MNRIRHVEDHFDSEAGVFDARVIKFVPYYREMLEALIGVIPFAAGRAISAADLGCGTGTVARLLKKRYPKARVACVDLSQKMIETAVKKFKGISGIDFIQAELGGYRFASKYDLIVSSLALHHINPGKEKAALYKKIHGALKKGGIFINADIVVSRDRAFQEKYLKKWGEFVLRSVSEKEKRENYQRYKREDRPAALVDEIDVLRKVGFRGVDVFWKYYNFAVYGGRK